MAASPHDVETDAMLVFAAQDGDADAFSELFRRHYPTVRRACARRLRDLREADEVAQAAFVRAYERLDRCTGDRRFGAWVQVIANNLCVDHMRAAARTSPSEDVAGDQIEPVGNPPEDALLRAEQAALIQRALASLPDRQRDVVVARDVDGRRPPEIAAALGLSLGAVDSLLLRARRRLAASVQAMNAESGVANFATTTAVAAVGSTAPHFGALARFAQSVSDAIATVSFHVASTVGMVPGVPSIVSQAAPAAAAGALALAPLGVGGHTAHVPAPALPPVDRHVITLPLPKATGGAGVATTAPEAVPALLSPLPAVTAPVLTAPSTNHVAEPTAPAPGPLEAAGGTVTNLLDTAVQTLR